jgi:hypothetical protein
MFCLNKYRINRANIFLFYMILNFLKFSPNIYLIAKKRKGKLLMDSLDLKKKSESI